MKLCEDDLRNGFSRVVNDSNNSKDNCNFSKKEIRQESLKESNNSNKNSNDDE